MNMVSNYFKVCSKISTTRPFEVRCTPPNCGTANAKSEIEDVKRCHVTVAFFSQTSLSRNFRPHGNSLSRNNRTLPENSKIEVSKRQDECLKHKMEFSGQRQLQLTYAQARKTLLQPWLRGIKNTFVFLPFRCKWISRDVIFRGKMTRHSIVCICSIWREQLQSEQYPAQGLRKP
jgi:hypothetical protein